MHYIVLNSFAWLRAISQRNMKTGTMTFCRDINTDRADTNIMTPMVISIISVICVAIIVIVLVYVMKRRRGAQNNKGKSCTTVLFVDVIDIEKLNI